MHLSWVWCIPLYFFFSFLLLALDILGSYKMYGMTCPWKLLQLESLGFMSALIFRAVASSTLRGQTPDFQWLFWPSLSIHFVQSIHLSHPDGKWDSIASVDLCQGFPQLATPLFSSKSCQSRGMATMAKMILWEEGYTLTRERKRKSVGWWQENLSCLKCTWCQNGLLFLPYAIEGFTVKINKIRPSQCITTFKVI